MAYFVKTPQFVEAFRYWLDCRPDWFCDKVTVNEIITYETHCDIQTSEGILKAAAGDYVVKDSDNKIFVCKPEIFEADYELIYAE